MHNAGFWVNIFVYLNTKKKKTRYKTNSYNSIKRQKKFIPFLLFSPEIRNKVFDFRKYASTYNFFEDLLNYYLLTDVPILNHHCNLEIGPTQLYCINVLLRCSWILSANVLVKIFLPRLKRPWSAVLGVHVCSTNQGPVSVLPWTGKTSLQMFLLYALELGSAHYILWVTRSPLLLHITLAESCLWLLSHYDHRAEWLR